MKDSDKLPTIEEILATRRHLVDQGFYSRIIADEKIAAQLNKLMAEERYNQNAIYGNYASDNGDMKLLDLVDSQSKEIQSIINGDKDV